MIGKYEKLIGDSIKRIAKIEVTDLAQNLLSSSIGIPAYLFLYVIDELEKETFIPVSNIVAQNAYQIFSITGLAEQMENYANLNL